MEKQSREAGALAIRNIGVIEQAYNLIDNELSNEVFYAVEKIIEENLSDEWEKELPCREKQAWSGEPSWLSLRVWREDSDSWLARFYVREGTAEAENDLWDLTSLCGQGHGELGFRWYKDDGLPMQKKAWKTFAAQQNVKFPQLKELNFSFEEKNGTWFIPLSVDSNELANAYAEEETERVLEPAIKECLVRIQKAVPIFSAIISEARKLEKKSE
jgi:hypothetical protein